MIILFHWRRLYSHTQYADMGLSKLVFVFFFFLFFSFSFDRIKISNAEDCTPYFVSCGSGEKPFIEFPFSVQYFGSCAYPGFNMSCNGMLNPMSIQIGSWGEFIVKDVDYLEQRVQIHDQHNCLPRRLLKIDLSGSPFKGAHYKNFTFYNCSSEFSTNISRPIRCLSTQNSTVFASSNSSSKTVFSACDVIASIMVPSLSRYGNDEINNDLHLVWDTPNCRECVGLNGDCGFKNTESRELKCFLPDLSPPTQSRSKARKQAIVLLGICIPILFGFILTICCVFRRRMLSDANNLNRTSSRPITQHHNNSQMGLDESVIQSYPETVLGESGRLPKPEDITCSICLSEYQPKETLKTVPDCKHCFHATCIDEWLRRNATCPICRTSPKPMSPLAG